METLEFLLHIVNLYNSQTAENYKKYYLKC